LELFGDFSRVLLSILFEALPFVLLGSLVSGIMEVFLPSEALTRILPKNRFLATLSGAVAGLALPMCECGVVPVMRRLIRKGTPLNVALAYMLAAPMVNPIVILSTMVAFRSMRPLTVTGLRVGLGLVIAMITSAVVTAFAGKNPHTIELRAPTAARPSWREGSREALGHAGRDFIEIGAFLVIGAAISAALNILVERKIVVQFAGQNVMATVTMMGMALVLNLCSEADAFVAWSFRDFSISSRLAFLVLGPMLDMKLISMYTRVFRRRTILILCASSVVLVFTATLLLGNLWPELSKPSPLTDAARQAQQHPPARELRP
jgi:uncharacterized membrane protein YraQ (UPF0718 family)